MRSVKKFLYLLSFALLFSQISLAAPKEESVDYADAKNWAFLETDKTFKDADVFFICPTVFAGDAAHLNMELTDEKIKKKFVGAINMEKGIYDENARFFAPYYRMAGFSSRGGGENVRKTALEYAYKDVRDAFLHYLKQYNKGRPFILAGFSQGSNHIVLLLKEFGDKKFIKEQMIAAYAPGWYITKEDIVKYPQLKPAKGEKDTGVIISFNTEAEDVTSSVIVPGNVKTISINPLSWRVNNKIADKSLNLGACFMDYNGKIKKEIPHFTGAYIDKKRGTLKVTDVNEKDYPNKLPQFASGVYHIYDYQFFYRNLQENVKKRIEAFKEEK